MDMMTRGPPAERLGQGVNTLGQELPVPEEHRSEQSPRPQTALPPQEWVRGVDSRTGTQS